MMTCDRVRSRLTAFVDGELDETTLSAVRGHLRTCAACQAAACDEAAVRDELGALPAPAPPASLWTAIERGLAQAEVADSRRSSWSRTWQRVRRTVTGPRAPVFGGALAACAVAVVVVHIARRPAATPPERPAIAIPSEPEPVPVPAPVPRAAPVPAADDDVAAAIAAVPAQVDARYQLAVDGLLRELEVDRQTWPAPRQAAFAAQLATLQRGVADAALGRPREKAWRAVLAAVQAALVAPQIAGLP